MAMLLCCLKSLHSTLVIGGKNGAADTVRRIRGKEERAQKRRKKINNACVERAVELDAHPREQ